MRVVIEAAAYSDVDAVSDFFDEQEAGVGLYFVQQFARTARSLETKVAFTFGVTAIICVSLNPDAEVPGKRGIPAPLNFGIRVEASRSPSITKSKTMKFVSWPCSTVVEALA